eukprot:Lithocolla_globosa_v1_NODE_12319_length_443_cov_37.118557.p1 type:complete len:108 gc:universal NODE_12319_length_443_cov_37.118557:364-41(-)
MLMYNTGGRIFWRLGGGSAPTVGTHSNGARIILYPWATGSEGDYAYGFNHSGGNYMWAQIPADNGFYKWRIYGGTSNMFQVTNGSAYTRTGTFGTISDRRKKKDIVF